MGNESKYRAAEERLWESVGRSPSERYVTLAGTGTRVRVQEVGDGPPALFLHGGPNSGSTWAPLLEHLDGFRCLLLDRPGTGLSERARVTREGWVDFAASLPGDTLDALEIESAHLVASSLGGYCALWAASRSPECFDRMVQMACPALLPGQQPPNFMKAIMKPGLRKIIAALPPTKKSGESIMRQIGHGYSLDHGLLPAAHDEWYQALQRYTDTMRNDFDVIHMAGREFGNDTTIALSEEALAKVSTPTHFIWGADDGFGGEDVAEWVTSRMPNATFEMMDHSGHLPWLDDAGHVAAATAAFLNAASTT